MTHVGLSLNRSSTVRGLLTIRSVFRHQSKNIFRVAVQASVSGVAIEDAVAAAISHEGVMGVQYDPGVSTCIRHKARASDIPTPSAAMRISMSPMPNRRVFRSIDVPPALSPFETNSADFGR